MAARVFVGFAVIGWRWAVVHWHPSTAIRLLERAKHRLPQRPVRMRQVCRLTGLSSSVRVLHARSWFGFEPPRHSAFSHAPREQVIDLEDILCQCRYSIGLSHRQATAWLRFLPWNEKDSRILRASQAVKAHAPLSQLAGCHCNSTFGQLVRTIGV